MCTKLMQSDILLSIKMVKTFRCWYFIFNTAFEVSEARVILINVFNLNEMLCKRDKESRVQSVIHVINCIEHDCQ